MDFPPSHLHLDVQGSGFSCSGLGETFCLFAKCIVTGSSMRAKAAMEVTSEALRLVANTQWKGFASYLVTLKPKHFQLSPRYPGSVLDNNALP